MARGEEISLSDMELRRIAVLNDLNNGVRPGVLSKRYNVSRTSIHKWIVNFRKGGIEGLKRKNGRGRPSKLTPNQKVDLRSMIEGGAKQMGFDDNRWTSYRIAAAIESRFGIKLHHDSARRMVGKMSVNSLPNLLKPYKKKNASIDHM